MSSSAIQKLREYFEHFPGIGPRQAQRFVYWLLNQEPDFVKNFGELLLTLKSDAKQCNQCFRFFTPPLAGQASQNCAFCDDINRDNSRILVMEKDTDMENIEKAGVYNGRYFVLGDIIPFGQAIPKTIRLKELYSRAGQNAQKELKEIILAFGATAEGDNTCRYLEKILESLDHKSSVHLSRFGRGI